MTITAPSLHYTRCRGVLSCIDLYHRCTITAPSLHHRCTIAAPSLHHHGTITAPSLEAREHWLRSTEGVSRIADWLEDMIVPELLAQMHGQRDALEELARMVTTVKLPAGEALWSTGQVMTPLPPILCSLW